MWFCYLFSFQSRLRLKNIYNPPACCLLVNSLHQPQVCDLNVVLIKPGGKTNPWLEGGWTEGRSVLKCTFQHVCVWVCLRQSSGEKPNNRVSITVCSPLSHSSLVLISQVFHLRCLYQTSSFCSEAQQLQQSQQDALWSLHSLPLLSPLKRHQGFGFIGH